MTADNSDTLLEKRLGHWNIERPNELAHTFRCIEELKEVTWAKPLVLKTEPAIQLLRWLQDNRDQQNQREWLKKWNRLEELKPSLFEVRYAYDIHKSGFTPTYEAKTLNSSSVDFALDIDDARFLIEAVSTLQSEAITKQTEHISENARIVGSDNSYELLKVQGKIVRKVAREAQGRFAPHKFPLPTGVSSTFNILIADTRGFSGGDDLDAADRFQLVYGAREYLNRGGNEFLAHGFGSDWLSGLFDVSKTGDEARIFRERIQLLGLVSEVTFGEGEAIRQTRIYRNHLLSGSKVAEEKYPFKGLPTP